MLQPIGFGTEKVEERFRRDFPDVAVEVLDRDSTRKKGCARRASSTASGAAQTRALIGTQMLSKGHHFPNVTLTGVLNADSILGYPDFRSAEKTFYLLTQVAGRSGRGELRGKVMIQTAFPTHYAIQHALAPRLRIVLRSRDPVPQDVSLPAGDVDDRDPLSRREHHGRRARGVTNAGACSKRPRSRSPARASRDPLPRRWRGSKACGAIQILLRSPQRTALRRAVEVGDAAAEVEGRRRRDRRRSDQYFVSPANHRKEGGLIARRLLGRAGEQSLPPKTGGL